MLSTLRHTVSTTLACLSLLLLNGCGDEPPPQPQVRPVKSVTVQHRLFSQRLSLTGHVRAQEEINLAFRIDGKLMARPVSVGDRATAGQVVAQLDPQIEQNALRAAEADLLAAQAVLDQTQRLETRQRDLLGRGSTPQAQYDVSQQQFRTAQAQVDSAQARVHTAAERVNYCDLHADAPGIVLAKGAEPGEVVRAGQMVLRIAREGLKDAVFDAPAHIVPLLDGPRDAIVQITLADDPSVKAQGRVREVAPQPDSATRTFPVRIALIDPPAAMQLGSVVIGSISVPSPPVIEIPSAALTESNGHPAVWVVEASTQTVALRPVEVLRYESDAVLVAKGLDDGEVVITAGVQVLRPGQKVKLLGAPHE
jgi:RND family efflux transporter MFP subunit